MLISILFVSIIIVYGFIGLKKGGIKSIGGRGRCGHILGLRKG